MGIRDDSSFPPLHGWLLLHRVRPRKREERIHGSRCIFIFRSAPHLLTAAGANAKGNCHLEENFECSYTRDFEQEKGEENFKICIAYFHLKKDKILEKNLQSIYLVAKLGKHAILEMFSC